MRIGLLGAGGIAGTMAETVAGMEGVRNYAIASRGLEKAEAFARKYHMEKAYGSYEEMLADDNVDLVYIATPHSHHYEWTIAALNAGKNVLCEKAFAANRKQAEEMIALAERKKLLLTEAIWTRYMPSRSMIRKIIDRGDIGEVKTVSSNLGYPISGIERLIRPELAGGCLVVENAGLIKPERLKKIVELGKQLLIVLVHDKHCIKNMLSDSKKKRPKISLPKTTRCLPS